MEYLLVAKTDLNSMMERLDAVKGPSEYTLHYTEPIQPVNPEYGFVLLPIDERAESVLTPEEWSSRLSEKPPEFVPPDPQP